MYTLHFGSRKPVRYLSAEQQAKFDAAPPEVQAQYARSRHSGAALDPEQPGSVSCRIKVRVSHADTVAAISEVTRVLEELDHDGPVWVASDTKGKAELFAAAFKGIPVREWAPDAGDE